jgi:hypothetical protein
LFSDDTRELFTRFESIYCGRTHRYLANCTQFPQRGDEFDWLEGMLDTEIDISLKTLRKYCIQLEYWAELMGYGRTPEELKLADDYHVTYHRGKFNGERAYYVKHSGIEHIWLPEEAVSRIMRRRNNRFHGIIGDVRACRTAVECEPKFEGLRVFRPQE